MTTKRAPDGLGRRGRAFWRHVSGEYVLSQSEGELLLETCRTLDLVEGLQASIEAGLIVAGKLAPAVSEIRQQRLALGRLLSQLEIPADEKVPSPTSIRARRAAESRWAGHTRRGAS